MAIHTKAFDHLTISVLLSEQETDRTVEKNSKN